MNYKIIVVLLLLIYMTSLAFAIEVEPIEGNNPSSPTYTDPQQVNNSLLQVRSQVELVNAKVDKLITKDEVLNLLQGHLNKVNEIQEAFRVSLVINFILLGLCLIGFAYGVLFYFKGKGRL